MFQPALSFTSDVLARAPSISGPRTVGTSRPQVDRLAARSQTSRNSSGTSERGTALARHGAAGTPDPVVEVDAAPRADVVVADGAVVTVAADDDGVSGDVVVDAASGSAPSSPPAATPSTTPTTPTPAMTAA